MELALNALTGLLNVFTDHEKERNCCVLEHTYLLPSHPSQKCIDPESITGDYENYMVSKWKFVSCLLTRYKRKIAELNNDKDDPKWISMHIEELIETIYCSKNNDPNDYYPQKTQYESLRYFLNWISIRRFDDLFVVFFTQTLPKCIDIALKMDELFPSNKLEWKFKRNKNKFFHEQYISFSREQVLCLLIHMFFNTTWRDTDIHKYWTNFDIYYQQNQTNQCVFSYLWTLIHYFNHFVLDANHNNDNIDDFIIFKRISMCDYSDKLKLFDSMNKEFVEKNHDLEINILNQDMLNIGSIKNNDIYVIDFANKYVGFGRSGTQEEVIFGSHPEGNIIMLIAPSPMKDNEVIAIENVQTIARFKNKGQNLRFDKCVIDQSVKLNIIASDASELDVIQEIEQKNDFVIDLKEPYFSRDLLKAVVMFGATCIDINEHKNKIIVRTGLWGCGAFRGNKYIKILLQIIAANHISNKIDVLEIYCQNDYCQDDTFRNELVQFIKHYNLDKDITLQKILHCLINNKQSFLSNCNLFEVLL